MVETGVLVTLGLFIAGLVYHAGRHSARLEAVEQTAQRIEAHFVRELAELKTMMQTLLSRRRADREEG